MNPPQQLTLLSPKTGGPLETLADRLAGLAGHNLREVPWASIQQAIEDCGFDAGPLLEWLDGPPPVEGRVRALIAQEGLLIRLAWGETTGGTVTLLASVGTPEN